MFRLNWEHLRKWFAINAEVPKERTESANIRLEANLARPNDGRLIPSVTEVDSGKGTNYSKVSKCSFWTDLYDIWLCNSDKDYNELGHVYKYYEYETPDIF